MNIIVAVDNHWGIGNNGELLYHIKEDMKRFKKLTMGKCVIMGRKTFESLPDKKPLSGRTNIILTSDMNYKVEGAIVVHSIEELKKETYKFKKEDAILIGGESLYNQLLTYCDQIFLTLITPANPNDRKISDSIFPDIDNNPNWDWTYKDDIEYDEDNDVNYQFITYRNKYPYTQI